MHWTVDTRSVFPCTSTAASGKTMNTRIRTSVVSVNVGRFGYANQLSLLKWKTAIRRLFQL
jgi:hypothetical protein